MQENQKKVRLQGVEENKTTERKEKSISSTLRDKRVYSMHEGRRGYYF